MIPAYDLGLLKDGAILANAGHFPWETEVAGLETSPDVEQTSTDQDESPPGG